MSDWREVPASEVERVIREWNRNAFPPSFSELVSIAERVNFRVCCVSPVFVPAAFTDHRRRIIWIPCRHTSEPPFRVLLHEIAEVLLRLPVAPPFHFSSWNDEHHNVARRVERRAKVRGRL